MSKKLFATYGIYKSYRNTPSNKWLALSEFIDNSISSWNSYSKDNYENINVEGLEISIIFDGTDEKNKKLYVRDNANAMNKNYLEDVLKLSDTKGKNDKQYNQHGVGMKLGIFWYGEDGIIYSKQKNSKEYFVELRTSSEYNDPGADVEVESKKSFENIVKYDSGTTIIVEKIYDNRWLKTNDLTEIADALGWRYRELLIDKESDRHGMKISLFQKVNDNRTKNGNKEIIVKPFFVNSFTFNSFVEHHKKKKNFDFETFKSRYSNDIETLIKENKSNDIILEFCEKLKNNQPLESVKEIEWEGCDKPAILKFGIINSEYENKLGKLNGLTTFHLNRAINHGPNNAESNSCIPFSNKDQIYSSSGDPTWRRLYGEINLTGYEKPDQNKSRFDWSYNGEENLREQLAKIWNDLKDLLKLIVNWEKILITNQITNAKDKEKLINFSKGSLDLNKIYPRLENCEITEEKEPCFYIEEEDKNIWILENINSELINIDAQDEKNVYVHFNANHKFWKPFIDSKDTLEYRGNSIYPLILLVALCGMYLDYENYFKGGFLSFDDKEKRYFDDVVDLVVKTIESKNEK
ncbi:MAG: hypothetical protein HDR31_01340 [Mycoplasma sp.]|nr:hypothetical protein [Mycoplasma sp.]